MSYTEYSKVYVEALITYQDQVCEGCLKAIQWLVVVSEGVITDFRKM